MFNVSFVSFSQGGREEEEEGTGERERERERERKRDVKNFPINLLQGNRTILIKRKLLQFLLPIMHGYTKKNTYKINVKI